MCWQSLRRLSKWKAWGIFRDILVRPFAQGAHYFDVKYSLPQEVYEQFKKDKIEIPFQQIVVHNA